MTGSLDEVSFDEVSHFGETQLTTVINDWAKILASERQIDTFILDNKIQK